MQELGEKPSTAWIRGVQLRRLEAGVAVVAVPPGQRDLQRFLGGIGRDQLARQLTAAMGRPFRVEVEAPAEPDTRESTASQPAGPSPLQQAMTLPLVKQVMDLFDVSIVDAHPARPASAPAPATTSAGAPDPQAPTPPAPTGPAAIYDGHEHDDDAPIDDDPD